jgi:hypothetical protein
VEAREECAWFERRVSLPQKVSRDGNRRPRDRHLSLGDQLKAKGAFTIINHDAWIPSQRSEGPLWSERQ